MKETIKRQKLFFVSLIGIVVVSLALTTTFAYQTLQISEAEGSNKEITLNTGVLDVTFTKTNTINLTNMPLLSDYKTAEYIEFTIDNTNSTADAAYQISLTELEYSTNLKSEDFNYTLTLLNDENKEYIIGEGDFSGLVENSHILNFNLGTYRKLIKGNNETLRLYLWLKETNESQNDLENTSFKGKIEIVSAFAADKENNVFKLNVYGNTLLSYKEGTTEQSTDNPATVTSLGTLVTDETSENFGKYKVDVTVSGKNLFKFDSSKTKAYRYSSFELLDNGVKATGNLDETSPNTWKSGYVQFYSSNPIKAGTYTVSWKQVFDTEITLPTKPQVNFYGYDTNNSRVYSVNVHGSYDSDSQRFIYEISPEVDLAYWYIEAVLFGTTCTITDAQLEKGTESTEYTPFIEPITEDIYIEEPLRKVEDFADYIDFNSKKVVRKITELKLTGDDKFADWGEWAAGNTLSNGMQEYGLVLSHLYVGTSLNDMGPLLCSHFKTTKSNSAAATTTTPLLLLNYSRWRNLLFVVDPEIYPDVATWQTYLRELYNTGNPVTVVAVLKDETEEVINIPTLNLNKNNLNISVCDSQICSSNIEIE